MSTQQIKPFISPEESLFYRALEQLTVSSMTQEQTNELITLLKNLELLPQHFSLDMGLEWKWINNQWVASE